jgi:hypothetical protein
MSLLDKASLIVTPNAYKESKLYSVVPSNGTGDMDVVRATTATRVNSSGLIEVVPRNLLTYSNTFTNVLWVKNSCTITANSIISPDGTQNASKLVEGTANDSHHIYQNAISSGQNTFTFYAKQGERKFVYAYADNVAQGKCFDLENGTLGVNIIAAPLNSSITSVGNGWYRCSITISITATALRIGACSANGTFSYLGNGTSGIYIYGAQLDLGSTATEYFPTTTRLNIPRIDYTNGSCPSLLVEPQRTNLLLRSQEFGTSPWAFGGVLDTVSSNTIISPDGTQNADTFVCGYTGYSSIYQSATTTSGTLYTFSVFAKKGNQNKLSIELRGADTTPNIVFDLNNGTILSGSGGTITSVGNGWYKCTLTKLANSTSTLIIIGRGLTGSIGDTFSLYGAQLEAGAYATSYIPTVASTVTRNADVISKTGISSLIGQTEGTMFCDFRVNSLATFGTILSVNSNSTSNYIYATINSSGQLKVEVFNGAVQTQIFSTVTVGNRYKLAFGYKTNDFVLYINGVSIGTDTVGTTFSGTTLSRVDFDITVPTTFSLSSLSINSAQLYKTRLTDTELAQLTTL